MKTKTTYYQYLLIISSGKLRLTKSLRINIGMARLYTGACQNKLSNSLEQISIA